MILKGCLAVALSATGCASMEDPSGGDLDEIEAGLDGEALFTDETFGGNGRTCATCHPSADYETGTLSPADVQRLFAADPGDVLFQQDGADTIGGNTFNRIREHATILIRIPLPGTVTIAGSSARSVDLPRGIPTTMNTPALDPVLMYDGREPSLRSQAGNAIIDHAQSRNFSNAQLDAIATFQKGLFNNRLLRDFVKRRIPLKMPFGRSESEKRGRRWFIDDGLTDPGLVGESKFNVCGFCHSGPMLNSLSRFFVENIDPFGHEEGFRFFTVLVAEFNAMGNPVNNFEFHNPDGSITTVPSPDPGIFLQTGEAPPLGVGWFKIPTVWGVKFTAPYFHDNSAKSLTDLMNHYDQALFILSANDPVPPTLGQIDLSEQDKADIAAYMKLL
jgi:cytochrome c peroxidase